MSDLDAAVRKAELQHQQSKLNFMFNKNMQFFRKAAPEIFQMFKSYQPEELRLSLHPDGYVELVNFKLNLKPVYPKNPIEFVEEQVASFYKAPAVAHVRFLQARKINDQQIHIPIINELIDQFSDVEKHISPDHPYSTILFVGAGLGYQIETILQEKKVFHAVVYDPHKDSFYASMHTVDWENIVLNLNTQGGSINFLLGMTPEAGISGIRKICHKIGAFNTSVTFFFKHLNSDEANEFMRLYHKEYQLPYSQLGFFDDELTSVSHTVENINRNVPIIDQTTAQNNLPPLIIVGNGPSLDHLESFIKNNINSAIIMSGGTAIGSLHKMGIKPDFHVEIERTRVTHDWITKGTTAEFREGITLLALNTVGPETISLFEERAIGVKPFDAGKILIDQECEAKLPLMACNPTVANGALSFATAMGFTEIYLVGIDLGMKEGAEHHSKHSLHYEVESKTGTKVYTPYTEKERNYTRKGNFGGEVTTTAVLDNARNSIEFVLNQYPSVNCYNPNDGLLIGKTKTVPPEELPHLPSIDKKEVVKSLKISCFKSYNTENLTADYVRAKYLDKNSKLKSSLKLKKDVINNNDLILELNRSFRSIRNIEDLSSMLFRGSFENFAAVILRACLFAENQKQFNDRYRYGRKQINKMIEAAFTRVDSELLHLDKTTREDINTLKTDK